jgi:transcriptional regulator with XRE-family HTH domain
MANNINALRLAFLLDAREFARLIGIYPDYMRRLESGDRPLTDLWIDAIARSLGVPADAVTNPATDFAGLAKNTPRPQREPTALCPIAARYAISSLVAKLGGLKTAQRLDEDELADAVQSLVSFIEEGRERGDGSAGLNSNRLLKGLQITALTILQSRASDLPADLEQTLERLAPGAVSLLEAYSAVAAPVRLWEN